MYGPVYIIMITNLNIVVEENSEIRDTVQITKANNYYIKGQKFQWLDHMM